MAEAAARKIIDRKYRLLSKIDQGAMGLVSRAEQLDLEGHSLRHIALKTIRREFSADPQYAKRFLHEVRVAMQLRSPHTVTVYDSGKDEEGQLYYVMELVSGQTLKQVLQTRQPVPIDRVVRISGQICEALAEAHGLPQPVVHRDLKPANIFVEQRHGQDWVKLGDFGIAKVLGEDASGLTQAGMSSPGTPRYMASEQWTGEAIDGRTDLYALGVILYEMLAGKAPFTGETQEALRHQHLHMSPPPLSDTVPAGIRALVGKLLAKAPHERPADALSIRRVLEVGVTEQDRQSTAILRNEASGFLEKTEIVNQERREKIVLSGSEGKKWWQSWIPHVQLKVAISFSVTFLALFSFAYLFQFAGRATMPVPTLAPGDFLPQAEQEQSTVTEPAVPRATPLALRLAVMKRRGNTVSVLKEGEALTSGEYYGVFFEPAQESFVYVLQQDTTGKIDILFPDPKVTPQTNPVPASKAVWVPQDEKHWFYLDQNKGREVIIVAASSQRDEKLESLLQNLDDTRSQSALVDWMVAPERGRGGIKRLEAKPRFSPEGKSLDLETTLVQGNGTDFVYKVAFEHK